MLPNARYKSFPGRDAVVRKGSIRHVELPLQRADIRVNVFPEIRRKIRGGESGRRFERRDASRRNGRGGAVVHRTTTRPVVNAASMLRNRRPLKVGAVIG